MVTLIVRQSTLLFGILLIDVIETHDANKNTLPVTALPSLLLRQLNGSHITHTSVTTFRWRLRSARLVQHAAVAAIIVKWRCRVAGGRLALPAVGENIAI